jgi:hypothetical protein
MADMIAIRGFPGHIPANAMLILYVASFFPQTLYLPYHELSSKHLIAISRMLGLGITCIFQSC